MQSHVTTECNSDCKDGGFSGGVTWAERFAGVSAYMREKDETEEIQKADRKAFAGNSV